jgi:hypothetical protein
MFVLVVVGFGRSLQFGMGGLVEEVFEKQLL